MNALKSHTAISTLRMHNAQYLHDMDVHIFIIYIFFQV